MRKALFVINSLSGGGAERVCLNLADELLLQGFAVDFAVLKKSSGHNIDKRINVITLAPTPRTKLSKLLTIPRAVKQLDRVVKERGEYELITSHLLIPNIVTALSTVKQRAIYVIHSTPKSFLGGAKSAKAFILKRMLFDKKIVCVSKAIQECLIRDYGFKKSNIWTIYNPIDITRIKQLATEKINKQYQPYFIVTGRFSKDKRPEKALEVFKLGNFQRKYKLLFCGTGELEQDIKQLAIKKGLEKDVIFLGWQKNSYKWIKNAELLLCTSKREGFPMVLVEALACGAKVVSSNCQYGPNEILTDEYSNYLVNSDDNSEYVEKINSALKNYPSSKKKILNECEASNVIKQYLKISGEKQ